MKRSFIVLTLAMLILTGCGTKPFISATDNSTASVMEENAQKPLDEATESAMDSMESPASMEQEANTVPQKSTEETAVESEEEPETLPSADEQTDELCVGFAKEVFDATNAERAAAGLPELIWSDELAIAADIRADEIIDEAHFSHVRPDGTKCYVLNDRIHGENIARGPHADGYEFVEHWMDSEGHKWNILCEQYTLIGVGNRSTEKGDTAVQIFGY